MMGEQLQQAQHWVVIAIAILAVLTLLASLKEATPYGRHMTANQRFTLPSKPAWFLFESPQWWAFAVTFWLTAESPSIIAILLFGLWQFHYCYRSLLYPLLKHDEGKRFPLMAVIVGIVFNALNGFANGWAVAHAPHLMSTAWTTDPRFVFGLVLAVSGWIANVQSDSILRNLRVDGFKGYRIPHGGLYRWISCPNYAAELLMWCGWALMSWTWAGLVFALFSIANLAPRAIAHHRWYRNQFSDYPSNRKALIPGLL